MSTFQAVDDDYLCHVIASARQRVIYVAPGVHTAVAKALGARLSELGKLDVTVILDPDEDVCRIGYGDEEGLRTLQSLATSSMIALRSQPGLRVGMLLSDDTVLVWSPTPRSVEAPPGDTAAPNGLVLGKDPGKQLSEAVAAEGSSTAPADAEIGQRAITPKDIEFTLQALKENPPIPVDLARITRVFSTKLEFVELEVKRAQLSKSRLSIKSVLLNADAGKELQQLLDSKVRAFGALRNEGIPVPAFTADGDVACGKDGAQLMEQVSEATLERRRNAIAREFFFPILNFGHLMEKDRKAAFQKRLAAYEAQVNAHSDGLRKKLDAQTNEVLDEAVSLIVDRHGRGAGKQGPDPKALREELSRGIERLKGDPPRISCVYKGVTYEQTQNSRFRELVKLALPAALQKRLGAWDTHFDAAIKAVDRKKR